MRGKGEGKFKTLRLKELCCSYQMVLRRETLGWLWKICFAGRVCNDEIIEVYGYKHRGNEVMEAEVWEIIQEVWVGLRKSSLSREGPREEAEEIRMAGTDFRDHHHPRALRGKEKADKPLTGTNSETREGKSVNDRKCEWF